MSLWKRVASADQSIPVYLSLPQDLCYYAREYISGGGYAASETNGLIANLKKDVSKKGTPEWPHKLRAIRKFAEELAPLVGIGVGIAAVPSSVVSTDPTFDDRLEQTLQCLKGLKPQIHVVAAFSIKQSVPAAHRGGSRNPTTLYGNLNWHEPPMGLNGLVILDDVLTTGAHYKACQRLALEKHPNWKTVGVFWAKTVWPNNP